MKLVDNFRGIAKPEVQCGDSILFWEDEWELNQSRLPLKIRYARLFSFVNEGKVSVLKFMSQDDFLDNFHLPLSARAH